MTIKVLMVDVDGVVVVHPNSKGWIVDLERDLNVAPEVLQAEFFELYFAAIVHGRVPLRDPLSHVLTKIAPHLSCDELISYWFANDAHLNHDLLQQLAEIRQRGLALHLATVQEHERANYLWQTLALREHFDAIHYAADLGWAKPAPEFFGEIERRSGFAPDEIFFIDDKADNVDAARSRGWLAATWTGERRLRELMEQAAR